MKVRPVLAALMTLALAFPLAARGQAADQGDRPGCEMPTPSDKAKVILFSTSYVESLSTSTIGSQDNKVGTATVTIEPGVEPLYIVIAARDAVIWRLQGEVGRVERLVLSSNTDARGDETGQTALAGATGITADRLAFLRRSDCIISFIDQPSIDAARAVARVRDGTRREPVVLTPRGYSVHQVFLPSGATKSVREDKSWLADADPSDQLWTRALTTYFAGVVDINPTTIVASQPAESYRLLPGAHGLLQLVKRGVLQQNKNGELIIRKKMGFPGGMYAGGDATFFLPKGVPAPDGDPGDSCIFSEETGEITGPDYCRRIRR